MSNENEDEVLERLRDELGQLRSKKIKLVNALKSGTLADRGVSYEQFRLMEAQASAMESYEKILEMRIDNIVAPHTYW